MIYFQDEQGEPGRAKDTVEIVEGSAYMDIDRNGNPIDIEILSASTVCPNLVEIAELPHYRRK